MKILQSSLFQAICAIIVGALLIKYPDDTMTWLTICIGILFLLPGVFSLVTYINARRNASPEQVLDAEGNVISGGTPTFPIVGLGSIVLGLFLSLAPGLFVKSLMYVLGAILVLGAIYQFMVLFNMRKMGPVKWGYYVLPALIFLTGLFAILKPTAVASAPLAIMGVCCIAYGVSEMINMYKNYKLNKAKSNTEEKADDNTSETQA